MGDWDWSSEDAKESLVVEPVRAIAVYQNNNGHIVIRQEAGDLTEEDQIIVFPPEKAQSLIDAIKRELN